MGIHVDRLAQIDALIAELQAGGGIASYSLPDGTSITLTSLKELHALRESTALLAAQETAGASATGDPAFRRARLRP